MQFKSLVLDVDGTLVPVGPYTTPSKRVCEAIKEVKGKVSVSLVSGRPLDWLRETFDILDLTAPCVINGGSQIVDPKTHMMLWERPLSTQSVEGIMSIIRRRGIASFTINDDGVEHKNPINHRIIKPLAIQLSYFSSKEDSDDCVRELQSIPNISVHKFYSWDKNKKYGQELYITHAGANKEHATRELLKILGVQKSETIAVGDSRNDLPLFEMSGLRVAMGNADAKLKLNADYIAPPVEEDGVAHVIEKFILREETAPKRKVGIVSKILNIIR